MRKHPRYITNDPTFRRSLYVRYADDFVFLLAGTLKDCQNIKEKLTEFLKENCGLILNEQKTTITQTTKSFKFLGAKIQNVRKTSDFLMKRTTILGKRISTRINPRMRIQLPTADLIEKLIEGNLARRNHEGKLLAKGFTGIVNLDHSTILQFFNHKINGLLSYFSFASNRNELRNII
jgi:hypothetical protein